MEESPSPKKTAFQLSTPSSRPKRLAILLWGQAGVGKTTFAGTAPGPKLWVNFDPDGVDSLTHLEDVSVIDLAADNYGVVEKAKEADPFRIGKDFLADDQFETVVVDSTTTFGDMALRHAVGRAAATRQGKSSTLEQPGLAGYGFKNAWVNSLVVNMLRMTARYGKHCIIICHEDKPSLNTEGSIVEVGLMLGSSLRQQVPVSFSEVWFMKDAGAERKVHVRPHLYYRPMKTRMFAAEGKNASFTWKYDLQAPDEGVTIAGLYEQWVENGGKKIPLPR